MDEFEELVNNIRPVWEASDEDLRTAMRDCVAFAVGVAFADLSNAVRLRSMLANIYKEMEQEEAYETN